MLHINFLHYKILAFKVMLKAKSKNKFSRTYSSFYFFLNLQFLKYLLKDSISLSFPWHYNPIRVGPTSQLLISDPYSEGRGERSLSEYRALDVVSKIFPVVAGFLGRNYL